MSRIILAALCRSGHASSPYGHGVHMHATPGAHSETLTAYPRKADDSSFMSAVYNCQPSSAVDDAGATLRTGTESDGATSGFVVVDVVRFEMKSKTKASRGI